MKNLAMLAIVACFGVTAANAQAAKNSKKAVATPAKIEVAPKIEGPGIQFDSETIDYGTIQKGADGNREFTFTNNGNKPLVIIKATGSCGCTVPSKPAEPILPGQKGTLGVKYDTNRPGTFSKTVTVTTNASETPKVLTIKGNVIADEPKAAPLKS